MQDFNPDTVRAGMKVPDNLRGAYDKIVKAGLKLMLDEKTMPATLRYLAGPDPVTEKLGKGTAGLMLYLFERSNRTMPPQLVIPAGIELLSHGADLLRKAGQEVSIDDIAEAMADFIQLILQKFDVKEKV